MYGITKLVNIFEKQSTTECFYSTIAKSIELQIYEWSRFDSNVDIELLLQLTQGVKSACHTDSMWQKG